MARKARKYPPKGLATLGEVAASRAAARSLREPVAAPAVVLGPEGAIVLPLDGEEKSDEEYAAEVEAELGARGSAKRVTKLRRMARSFLEDAKTPEERAQRLDAIRDELPRADRRLLGIKLDAAPSLRPVPRAVVEKLTKKCPRCSAEVGDLTAHRDECPKYKKKVRSWELDIGSAEGMTMPPPFIGMVTRSPAPSEDAGDRKVVGAEVAAASGASSLTSMTSAISEGVLAVKADAAEKAFDMVERCLVLADLLWPGEPHPHSFVLGTARSGGTWVAELMPPRRGISSDCRGGGKTPGDAVRALADALRAETKERARAAEEMARLLED